MNKIIVVFALCAAFGSCKKQEGEGGKASIAGKVYESQYDHNGKLINRAAAADKKVYIVYGDNAVFDNETRTFIDGAYLFNYLREGNYSIYAFSDCNTCPSGTLSKLVDVEITGKKEKIAAADLETVKYVDVNDGAGIIKGKVYAKNYEPTGFLTGQYYIGDEKVYLVYDTDSSYYIDTRTNFNGSYQFNNLIPGNYKVYAYSKCDQKDNSTTYASCQVSVEKTTQLSSWAQEVQLTDIIIYQ